ncbi:MAG: MauE/DoxX family redox-associated membrane protein [Solirubrobacteraceae bacterium]
MNGLLLAARSVLACAFVVAGMAKLVDLSGARRSLEQFGVPGRVASPLAGGLSVVEVAVGVALVPVASAWGAAVAATVLLLVFTAAVAVALGRGVQADCHCFGRISSRPIGVGTLARNAVLAALAVFVAVGGAHRAGTSATDWVGRLSTGEAVALGFCVVLALAVVFNAAFLVQLLRQNGRLWAELDELRTKVAGGSAGKSSADIAFGEPLPAVAVGDLEGHRVDLRAVVGGGGDTLLFFTDPRCGACDRLLPEIGRRQRDSAADPRVVMLSLGDPELNRIKAAEHDIGTVLLHEGFDFPRSLGIAGMPGAVLVDSDGRVASNPAVGAEAVSALLASSGSAQLTVIEAAR